MFASFMMNLNGTEQAFQLESENIKKSSYYGIGKDIYESDKNTSQTNLNQYLNLRGVLSAEQIEADWFPLVEADVFLSHSHRDESLAILLAGWLKQEYGIKAFIDSCVWGYADELLATIDKEYCMCADKVHYDYQKRNQSTSHVHMILNGALMKMIDSTDCLIFLNTPNSISSADLRDGEKTSSPWIYSELMISNMIKRKLRYREMRKDYFEHAAPLKIEYPVTADQLLNLTIQDIQKAGKSRMVPGMRLNGRFLLRQLYCDFGLIKDELGR